jgi:hypothetical protein
MFRLDWRRELPAACLTDILRIPGPLDLIFRPWRFHRNQIRSRSSVQHFRDEARRIRGVAARFTTTEIRQQMLDLAAQYDMLAVTLERRSP